MMFVVLGSHGGGTSLVAGMLNALGIDMHYNPDARVKHYLNYEDTKFVTLNAQILAAAGGSWDDPPPWTEVLSVRDDFEARIRDLIAERSDSELWGFKDPRTALTVGLYHPWLPNPQYICIKREIKDVVQSIVSRGPSGRSRAYWTRHAATHYERIETFLEAVTGIASFASFDASGFTLSFSDDAASVLRLDFEKLRTERGEVLRLAEFVGQPGKVKEALKVIMR